VRLRIRPCFKNASKAGRRVFQVLKPAFLLATSARWNPRIAQERAVNPALVS